MMVSANFIDDGSKAKITKSTEYVKTNVEKHTQVKVNGEQVVKSTNCSSHSEYDFGC